MLWAVHRIGQEKTVYVHRLLTIGTLEERIDKIIAEKRKISQSVMDFTTTENRKWSREELIELLKPID